ncbi:MAG: acyl-CoA thioesterase II [Gammaproteobacteria bacterium]|nr:MAG: acyl-CoA thioesterase II [Gammaproteobacteria bacterium]TDJ44389.1 MAG: acyl-CoA thioesterase II [Gammaproteobacteria bacterium]
MDPLLADLLSLLELERLEERIFRGQSRDIGSPRVFGGQVLGQALTAANYTVEGRVAHSLHAYFLRAGDVTAPIVYDVDVARDGRSFSNRRVVAIQHGRPIFNMTVSFQIPEQGLEHQATIPAVPGPDELQDLSATPDEVLENIPEKMRRYLTRKRPFEIRPVEPVSLLSLQPSDPVRHVWMRAVDRLPDQPDLHRNLLAYLSDFQLIGTATLPHGIQFEQGRVQMASLDHALWFHRPFRVDEWLLYSMESPNAASARGFALGRFFDTDGVLVASTAQEGLIRIWPSRKEPAGDEPKV